MTTTELKNNLKNQLEEAVINFHRLQGAIAALDAYDESQTTEEQTEDE